jgi:hypothetical protein
MYSIGLVDRLLCVYSIGLVDRLLTHLLLALYSYYYCWCLSLAYQGSGIVFDAILYTSRESSLVHTMYTNRCVVYL